MRGSRKHFPKPIPKQCGHFPPKGIDGYSFLNIGADMVGLVQYLVTIRQELG